MLRHANLFLTCAASKDFPRDKASSKRANSAISAHSLRRQLDDALAGAGHSNCGAERSPRPRQMNLVTGSRNRTSPHRATPVVHCKKVIRHFDDNSAMAISVATYDERVVSLTRISRHFPQMKTSSNFFFRQVTTSFYSVWPLAIALTGSWPGEAPQGNWSVTTAALAPSITTRSWRSYRGIKLR